MRALQGEVLNAQSPLHSAAYSHPVVSGWHSPIPYLFGGLAAMMGLIAFALLILACSYWKLSGYNIDEDGSATSTSDHQKPVSGDGAKSELGMTKLDVLVINPGQEKPTYLATKETLMIAGEDHDLLGKENISANEGERLSTSTGTNDAR